jgi:pyruvate-formate lyase-activating enzyme
MLLKMGLVDRVFFDIKTVLKEPDYQKAVGRENMAKQVEKSLEICLISTASLEARCTIFPEVPSSSNLTEIARMLCRLKESYPNNRLELMTLQQGHPQECEAAFEPVSNEVLQEMAKACRAGCPERLEIKVRAVPKITWKN